MKTISEGMGSGLIKHMELSDALGEEWVEFITLDMKIQASKVFQNIEWHCPQGICKESMTLLNHEFNVFRGLFPLKVFITGPPAGGKTHFAQRLSEGYGVPHIKIADLINAALKLTNAFGDEIKAKIEELKD